MRKLLSQSLRKKFNIRFLSTFPQFKKFKSENIWTGGLAYHWEKNEVHFFVTLICHMTFDMFNIEVAYGPACDIPNLLPSTEFPDPTKEQDLFRIVNFIWNRKGGEPWWELIPFNDDLQVLMFGESEGEVINGLSKIDPCLDEVFSIFDAHLIKFLDSVLENTESHRTKK